MKNALFLLMLFIVSSPSFAMDGVDSVTGEYIDVSSDEVPNIGDDVEFYDYRVGLYRHGMVESVDMGVVEVYDYEAEKRSDREDFDDYDD